MSIVLISEFLESSSLALTLQLKEKADLKVVMPNKNFHKILKGLIEKETDHTQYMGKGNIFVFDDTSHGKMADDLRARGEKVFGGSEISDMMENKRKFGQKVFKDAGILYPPSKDFEGVEAFNLALEYVKSRPGRYVFKQESEEDKSYNYASKFEDGSDMIEHLKDMKKVLTENIEFQIQDFVKGHEFGVEGWFTGSVWVKTTDGDELFSANWEHKKASNDDLSISTGEVGTLQYRLHQDSLLINEIKKLTSYLQKIKYVGNIDINFIGTDDGKLYALEFTTRFGYPALNMHQESMETSWGEFFEKTLKGENGFLEYDPSWTTVVCVTAPPFPFQSSKASSQCKGTRIFFLDKGEWKGKDSFETEKLKHLHPYEVAWDVEEKKYYCTGDTGYVLTCTGKGADPVDSNCTALEFIKDNVFIPNMNYRTDIGVGMRVMESIEFMEENGLL